MFQRIDRAAKGHITRADALQFLEENGFKEGQGYDKRDLKLIFKQAKSDYTRFVSLLLDKKVDNGAANYYNERMQECD